MAYYLLTVRRPGSLTYKEVANAKHQIEACSLDEAKHRADDIIADEYTRIEAATMQLFDGTGLLATRKGEGAWRA